MDFKRLTYVDDLDGGEIGAFFDDKVGGGIIIICKETNTYTKKYIRKNIDNIPIEKEND